MPRQTRHCEKEAVAAYGLPDTAFCSCKSPWFLWFPSVPGHPLLHMANWVYAVLVCRLRKQQGQGGQLLDMEGRAGSQAQGKLQDGCNNNILAHACSRGCSS